MVEPAETNVVKTTGLVVVVYTLLLLILAAISVYKGVLHHIRCYK